MATNAKLRLIWYKNKGDAEVSQLSLVISKFSSIKLNYQMKLNHKAIVNISFYILTTEVSTFSAICKREEISFRRKTDHMNPFEQSQKVLNL